MGRGQPVSERSSAAAQGGLSGVEVRVICLYFVAPVLRQCTHVSDYSESSKATASCETESKLPPPLVALLLQLHLDHDRSRPARRWRSLLAARTHYLASSSFEQASPSPSQPRPHLDEMADVPSDLKAVSPYLARARELTKAEPVIAYWCASSPSPPRPGSPSRASLTRPPPPPLPALHLTGTFYALQQAMSLRSSAPESQAFLINLMDQLEEVRLQPGCSRQVGDAADPLPSCRAEQSGQCQQRGLHGRRRRLGLHRELWPQALLAGRQRGPQGQGDKVRSLPLDLVHRASLTLSPAD